MAELLICAKQNVRRIPRRKRRKMPPEEYQKFKEKKDKKLVEYSSDRCNKKLNSVGEA